MDGKNKTDPSVKGKITPEKLFAAFVCLSLIALFVGAFHIFDRMRSPEGREKAIEVIMEDSIEEISFSSPIVRSKVDDTTPYTNFIMVPQGQDSLVLGCLGDPEFTVIDGGRQGYQDQDLLLLCSLDKILSTHKNSPEVKERMQRPFYYWRHVKMEVSNAMTYYLHNDQEIPKDPRNIKITWDHFRDEKYLITVCSTPEDGVTMIANHKYFKDAFFAPSKYTPITYEQMSSSDFQPDHHNLTNRDKANILNAMSKCDNN